MSKILRWIVNIVLFVSIVVACGLLIPPLAGVNTVIVDDVDMSTNLAMGSVTYSLPKMIEELAVGDDVLVQDSQGDYVYRITAIDVASNQVELEDIKSTDSQTRPETLTKAIPKVLFTVPFIGYVTMAMKSTEGLIIIGLAIIFIIILFILSELWKKDLIEDEEDEAEEDVKNTTVSVDMSAHILEKVSSEIGSEISNVMAQDNGQAEKAKDIETKEAAKDNGLAGDTVQIAKAPNHDDTVATSGSDKEIEQAVAIDIDAIKAAVTEKANEVKETVIDEDVPELAKVAVENTEVEVAEVEVTEVADTKVEDMEVTIAEVAVAEVEATDEIGEAIEELEESLEPVEMAMPIYTEEELLQKAKEAGVEPTIKKDDDLGIAILDYSELL